MNPKTLLCCLLALCGSLSLTAQYQLNGQLTGFADGTRFYLKDLDAQQDIDSTTITQGRFTMKGRLFDAPQTLWLYAYVGTTFYYCNLFIGNEKVTVKGDRTDMPYYLKVTGSKSQDVQNILTSQTGPWWKQRDSLVGIIGPLYVKNEQEERQTQLWKLVKVIDDTVTKITNQFIDQHFNSYAGVKELYYKRSELDTAKLRRLYNQLQPAYRNSRYGQAVHNHLLVGAPRKMGDAFADFTAEDTTGFRHRLGDKLGKYILLDFTQTYCGPCMLSVEEMKEAKAKHSDSLEIISFNVDPSRAIWLKGLQRDHPNWLSLWDGKGMYSETVMRYGVRGYPSFVLLDPKGKIVGQWSGYGKGNLLSTVQKKMAASR